MIPSNNPSDNAQNFHNYPIGLSLEPKANPGSRFKVVTDPNIYHRFNQVVGPLLKKVNSFKFILRPLMPFASPLSMQMKMKKMKGECLQAIDRQAL